jgi:hypothetical protein
MRIVKEKFHASNSAAASLPTTFGAQNSAAGRCAAMAPKALIVGGFSPQEGLFSGAEWRVLPVVREK